MEEINPYGDIGRSGIRRYIKEIAHKCPDTEKYGCNMLFDTIEEALDLLVYKR